MTTRRVASAIGALLIAIATTANAAYDRLISETLGLVTAAKGAEWTAQTQGRVAAVNNILPRRTPEELQRYKTITSVNQVLATFPGTDAQRDALNRDIDRLLAAKANRVKVVPIEEAQSVFYSGVSVRKEADGTAILEVLVAVADAADAKAKNMGGVPLKNALASATVWMSVNRKRLPWDAISKDGEVVFATVAKDIAEMYETGMRTLLLAL